MTSYEQSAQKCLAFIKSQLNVNNYTVFPRFNQDYDEYYTGPVSGTVKMPADAEVTFPNYIYCDRFYDETYSGVCSGKHQNTGTARVNLGVEVATLTDGRHVSCVCPLHEDGTWRTERYYRTTEIYGIDGVETKRVTYWYKDDVEINTSGSNGLKEFELKYYAWIDDNGDFIDVDNLPPTVHEGEDPEPPTDLPEGEEPPRSVLMRTVTYTLRPTLLDDTAIDNAIPIYQDYEANFFVYADVEYLSQTTNILYDEQVLSSDLPSNPPTLPDKPTPWIRDIIFSPASSTDTLSVSWISNFDGPCTISINGSSKTVSPSSITKGYMTYKATVRVERGSRYSYTISGSGVSETGTINYPKTNLYRIMGDPQLIDEASAQNWYAMQNVGSPAGVEPTLILSMGDQIDSIGNATLRNAQYTMFTKNQTVPIMVNRGNHDNNDAFLAHFNLPNAEEADYYFIHNGVLFVLIDTNHKDYDKHKRIIEEGLASGPYDWAVLITHHSLYSSGKRATSDGVLELRKALNDFIVSKPFDIVLSGHDHIYCRTSKPGKLFVTAPSSTGSKYYEIVDGLPWTEVSMKLTKPACIDMEVTSTSLNFSVINMEGKIIDEFEVTK